MSSVDRNLASERVLVTGASGFLAGALCRSLSDRGAVVHGVSRKARDIAGVSAWWTGSLADFEFVNRLFDQVRPALAFHLAGAVTGVRDLAAVVPTFEGNLTATVNVLTAAAEAKCPRVVMAGSLEEPEDATETPSSPYAASKLAAYQYAKLFESLYGVSVVVPRVFIVYGPGQDDPKKLIPHVVSSLLRGESPKLASGVRPVDWVYVDDVAEGLIAAALAQDASRIDIGSGQLVTVRELVERIARLIPEATGQPLFGALPDRPMEQVRVANVAATRDLIGWSPRTSLNDGLQRTVDWLRGRFKS